METFILTLCVCLISFAGCQKELGGLEKQKLSDPDYAGVKEDAQKSIVTHLKALGVSGVETKLLELEKQMVAGTMYYLTTEIASGGSKLRCRIKVWDRPWVEGHERDISDNCTEKIRKAIDYAMERINSMSNSLYRLSLIDYINTTWKPTKDGIWYMLQFSIGLSTKCRNNGANKGKSRKECPVDFDMPTLQICSVDVLNQPYLPPEESFSLVTRPECQAKPQKPRSNHTLGGDGHDECRGKFEQFKQDYNRLYSTQKEHDMRLGYFCDNLRRIKKLQMAEKGSAKYAVNKFADLSADEFRKMYLGFRPELMMNNRMKMAEKLPLDSAPESFDWRDHGAVTPVKNQGSCGSCWAFSTTGNIEGQWAIKKKALVSLSEQELVDCDKLDQGCEGGLPSNAYMAIEKLGGLETEKDYSYKGEDENCQFKLKDVKVYINSSVNISSDETQMAAWLAKNGPISIGINAFAMQFYWGGIAHPWSIFCNPKSLDHGVLIVGYGVKDGEPYWIIKNSWGPDWGEKGYYLVYRGGGVCGLNTMCTSAIVD